MKCSCNHCGISVTFNVSYRMAAWSGFESYSFVDIKQCRWRDAGSGDCDAIQLLLLCKLGHYFYCNSYWDPLFQETVN